jgi:hypothetical protein
MPPAEPKSRLPLTVYLPAATRHDVKAAAEALGQTLSKFAERALNAALRREPHSDRNGVAPNIGDAL